MRNLLCLCILAFSLSGCSVYLAAAPSDDYDISAIQPGVERADVESLLGRPFNETRMTGGSVARYQYLAGDRSNYHRASAYALLDLVTVGIAEAFTFPAEAVQGDRHELIIRYDTDNRVVNIDENVFENPLPEVQDLFDFSDPEPQEAFPVVEAKLPILEGPRGSY